jgi:integrase
MVAYASPVYRHSLAPRAGEVCALDADHLDLDAGTVYLPSRIQKGSPPPATLELATDTVRLLRRYLRDR